MIQVSHLKKVYSNGFEVLRDVNATIGRGEVISIIGPSGTGKSTFLRCLNLLESPSGGSIVIDGQNLLDRKTNVAKLRQKMGMVFQNFNLFNHMSVLDNLCIGPVKLLGKSRKQAEERAMELLTMVGLAEKAHVMPSQLSGGQKQRLCIARVFLKNPPILILDEATSALDNTTEILIQQALDELCKGRTTLVVAHRLSTIKNADEIAVVSDGKIIEKGTHDTLLSQNGAYAKKTT